MIGHWNRRQFLQTALSAGSVYLLGSLVPPLSFAQAKIDNDDRLLLVIRMNGAWDTLMMSDARTSEFLNGAQFTSSEFLQFDDRVGVKAFQQGQLGPALKPLFNNLDDLCIVNGVMMNMKSNVHEVNREYMSSGNLLNGTAFFPFALAQALGNLDNRVGYKMEYDPVRDGNYPTKIATPGLASYGNTVVDPYEEMLMADDDAASMHKKIVTQNRNEKATISLLNQLIAKTEEPLSSTNTDFHQVSYALAGLGSGFIKMAQVDMVRDSTLDTHDSHKTLHLPKLSGAFEQIAKIIKFMKETPYKLDPTLKKSLFDVTTVVITSEFSRTAYKENADGTSHNQHNNSVLLFGGNIKGGTLIGESQLYKKSETKNLSEASLFQASPFDFQTQKALTRDQIAKTPIEKIGVCKSPTNCLDYIYPETIWRTIALQYGIDNLGTLPSGSILKDMFKSKIRA